MTTIRRHFMPAIALIPIISMSGAAYNARAQSINPPNPQHPIPNTHPSIHWESSLKSAISRAQRERKPILHLQLFGKLTDALC